jgi:serine/threonine-protein kinase HipA
MAFEKLAIDLAESFGITVPETKLVQIDGRSVLLSKRFDRSGDRRIGYQSLMTALLKSDGEGADYLEIAEQITLQSERISADLNELFRRIALNIAIRNTDDHLRNHGLLRSSFGWMLSPAFDLNPNPISETGLRATSVAGAIGTEAEIAALIEHCEYFDLTRSKAKQVLLELSSALTAVEHLATKLGIAKQALAPFGEVFEISKALLSKA